MTEYTADDYFGCGGSRCRISPCCCYKIQGSGHNAAFDLLLSAPSDLFPAVLHNTSQQLSELDFVSYAEPYSQNGRDRDGPFAALPNRWVVDPSLLDQTSNLPELSRSSSSALPASSPLSAKHFADVQNALEPRNDPTQHKTFDFVVHEPSEPDAAVQSHRPFYKMLDWEPGDGLPITGTSVTETRSEVSAASSSRPAWCEKCKKWLASKEGLRRHRQTHKKSDKHYRYTCPSCPQRFRAPKDLNRHSLKHADRATVTTLRCIWRDQMNPYASECGAPLQNRHDNARRHVMGHDKQLSNDQADTYIQKVPARSSTYAAVVEFGCVPTSS